MAYKLGNRILTMGDRLFVATNPVWSGLTSYWRMETGTTVVDYGSNHFNGTSSNVSWVAGKKNNGAAFTSSNAKIVLADANKYNFERTDSFSFSLWVKRISLQNPAFLFQKQQVSLSYRGYGMSITLVGGTGRHEVIFQLFNSTTVQLQVRSNQSLTSTTDWYHIALTYNGTSNASGAKIYVNGVCDNYIYYNTLTNTTKNTTPLIIGNFETPTTNNTIIDEVGLWNRVLTQAEVTALYNSGNGLFY